VPVYRRILLKLSGEAIGAAVGAFNLSTVDRLALEIRKIYDLGVEIGIVVGGGNIVRGGELVGSGFNRIQCDSMGMLATLINSILLAEALRDRGVPTVLQSALPVETIAESITLSKTMEYLRDKQVILFAGGTGSPYFTTDTAAALRACEIEADVLMKATKVDGVYDRDPQKHEGAKFHRSLRFDDLLKNRLMVMDMAAVSMCRDRNLPILIFNITKNDSLISAVQGHDVGTRISSE
jgi:uridylate kinase